MLVCVELRFFDSLNSLTIEATATSPPRLLSAGPVVNVRGQMLGQVICPREALAARLAVVRSLPCVDPQVTREIGLAAESTATEEAHERSFARVLPHVQLEILL